MSRICAVLFATEQAEWKTQLRPVITAQGERDHQVATLLDGSWDFLAPNRLYRTTSDGAQAPIGESLLGCTYEWPVALSEPDPGPLFVRDKLALTYDGVISDHTGASLLQLLSAHNLSEDWDKLVRDLDGQFALLAVSNRDPQRIYYAVKAKPLYLLVDSLGRGTLVSSSKESLSGLYHPTRNATPVSIPPYTAGYITRNGLLGARTSLTRYTGEGTLVLSGGGLDTAVAAWDAKNQFPDAQMQLAYFDYGAKAKTREVTAIYALAAALQRRYPNSETRVRCYPLGVLGEIAASTLTDAKAPVSHRPQAGRASEWVPARNTVLMAFGLALAESGGYASIVTGINADAATAYPDNDPEWLERFRQLVPYAVGAHRSILLRAPLGPMTKVQIVDRGEQLGIPWKEVASWSCYEGGELHCGECSSCRARRKAFQLANVTDVTEYAA